MFLIHGSPFPHPPILPLKVPHQLAFIMANCLKVAQTKRELGVGSSRERG